MKKLLTTSILAIALGVSASMLSSTAYAANSKAFASTISAPASAVKINVTIGEDLAYRADNLPQDLRRRSNTRGNNNGFSGNGFYGQKDLNRLAERLERRMVKQLEVNGVSVSDDATTVLNLVITDAIPSRPTHKQLTKKVSLSFSSFALGGATFTGTMTHAGEEAGELSYAWYETDIRNPATGASTWSDANRAIDRFSRKTAKSLR